MWRNNLEAAKFATVFVGGALLAAGALCGLIALGVSGHGWICFGACIACFWTTIFLISRDT